MKTRETISTSADGGQATTNNNENEDDGMQKCASCPTASDLLELCKLPESSSATERQRRLATLELWRRFHPDKLATLLVSRESCDKKNGCLPLHWAAGTGFDEMIDTIIDLHHDGEGDSSTSNKPKQQEHTTNTIPVVAAVDQNAYHPSTGRTPLHYAARNGHLPTCQLLIERHGANPHPRCGRGSVTPLQLAVWQNRLTVVRYLVEQNTATATAIVDGAATASRLTVVQERNDFNCGLMHWVGLIPRKRWGGCDTDDENDENNDGSGVLPLARYLHSMGLSYDSTPSNANTQGHTPLHKAAWGGNLALIRYFREDHDIYDKVQDEAGNYCADIAKMRGNHEVAQWLLDHGSVDRHESYRILGLEVGASDEEVRQRYRDLARRRHPDKKQQQQQKQEHAAAVVDNHDTNANAAIIDDFVKIKEAYEHLTKEGGVGKQKNPKYDKIQLLENNLPSHDGNESGDDLFLARLLAVISDYGEDGFPLSLITRRWNQIWPDRPFPSPEEYIIEHKKTILLPRQEGEREPTTKEVTTTKKVKLLAFLKWECRGTPIHFRSVGDGGGGDVLVFSKRPSSLRRPTTEAQI